MRRVLLVDSDAAFQARLGSIAESLGLSVATSNDCRSYPDLFKASRPDLVVACVDTEGVGLLDVVESLSELDPKPRLLAVSPCWDSVADSVINEARFQCEKMGIQLRTMRHPPMPADEDLMKILCEALA